MTTEHFNPALLAAATDIYRDRDDYGQTHRWGEFAAQYPELASAALPKLDAGSGSGSYEQGGRYWREQRAVRVGGPRRKPTAMADGSPLAAGSPIRQSTPGEDDPDMFDCDGVEIVDLQTGGVSLDGVHGEHVAKSSRQNRTQYLLEYCELCQSPLPVDWPKPTCEFPLVPLWPTPPSHWPRRCRCNGCIGRAPKTYGRRYCSQTCKRELDNALDRERRRRAGAPTRKPFDPKNPADRLARFKLDMRDRARQRKADDQRHVCDWTGIWTVPPWRLTAPPQHRLNRVCSGAWQITLA